MKENSKTQPEISPEEQKEFDYIQGKINRRSVLFPHEADTWRKWRKLVLENKRFAKPNPNTDIKGFH